MDLEKGLDDFIEVADLDYVQKRGWADRVKSRFFIFLNAYGLLGIIACISVVFKFAVFYNLVKIQNTLAPVIVSGLIVLLIFSSFRNKKRVAIAYLLISLLLIADAMYFSYFSKYLSVHMIGAADVLGDTTESIKAIFRPALILLLLDNVLIFLTISTRVQERAECIYKKAFTYPVLAFFRKRKLRLYGIYFRRDEKNTYFDYALARKFAQPVAIALIALIIFANPLKMNFFTALSNQEIFNYRVRDTASLFIKDKLEREVESLKAFTDHYPDEIDGPLFGAGKGRNLIIIQVESFQDFVINYEYNGQELTPNLNRLLKENTTYFSNYYQQVGTGNTSDAEFATNNSIYGTVEPYTYKLYGGKNYFRGLPHNLLTRGYETAVLHPYEDVNFWNRKKAYPNLGFNAFYGGLKDRGGYYYMDDWLGWGLSDKSFYRQSRKYFKQMKQPFYAMVITLSNHHPYKMQSHEQRIKLKKEDRNTTVGDYLNSIAYTDKYLGEFFKQLKRDGIYNNSIIAIYGDHVGLAHSDETDEVMERLTGKKYDFDTMMNIPLIIAMPNSKVDISGTIDVAGGQMDFYPTVAYLLGIDDLDTIYFGHNLYAIDEGFVMEKTHMIEGSFFTNDVAFAMSRDGVFEHSRVWNYKTGEKLNAKDFREEYERSLLLSRTCDYILKNDVLRDKYDM